MKHSTGKPTKEEEAWIVACKEGPCVACLIMGFEDERGCDFHHLLSGGRRRGHLYGVGLCAWHHRRHPREGLDFKSMRLYYGPSLMDGSRAFHAVFGSDDELLELQRKVLAE